METRKFTVLFIFIWIGCTPILSQSNKEADLFIKIFAKKAIAEMEYSGIPASITLAQGILESDFGRSSLVIEGNNYFGIKCGSAWSGESIKHKDDDYDENGKLKNSCFRAYSSPAESFRNHSDFLLNRRRYKVLFSYGIDYKKWAHGLQSCGYATNKSYGQLLIKIIERYNLAAYDKPQSFVVEEVLVENEIPQPQKLDGLEEMTDTQVGKVAPPESVLLTEDYKRGSRSVQKMEERAIVATVASFDNDPDLTKSQIDNHQKALPSTSSQTIMLQRSYKSTFAKAK